MNNSRHLPGGGKPLLYLDFDGVLHPENAVRTRRYGPMLSGYPGHHLFENVSRLAIALGPYPDVRLVLSTSWVLVYGYDRARKRLGPLAPRVIGATYHTKMSLDRFLALPRGVQVLGDVGRRNPSSWIALDDDDEGWPATWRSNLVHTDDRFGLVEPAVWSELQRKLAVLR